jgi:hypothetical protein
VDPAESFNVQFCLPSRQRLSCVHCSWLSPAAKRSTSQPREEVALGPRRGFVSLNLSARVPSCWRRATQPRRPDQHRAVEEGRCSHFITAIKLNGTPPTTREAVAKKEACQQRRREIAIQLPSASCLNFLHAGLTVACFLRMWRRRSLVKVVPKFGTLHPPHPQFAQHRSFHVATPRLLDSWRALETVGRRNIFACTGSARQGDCSCYSLPRIRHSAS